MSRKEIHVFDSGPEPEGLGDDDRELVGNPIADYSVKQVQRWQAELLKRQVPAITLGRRMCAAIASGNWLLSRMALDEAEEQGLLRDVAAALAADAGDQGGEG